jgi:hypothetical protein
MTTVHFAHTHYPAEHPGVARAERVIESARSLRRGINSTRSLAAMLLASVVAALLVVADQLVDNWADGHLLVAWSLLWAVGFVALALFAGTARRWAARVMAGLDAWSARIAAQRADERLWAIAQEDARVMADLRVALAAADHETGAVAIATPQGPGTDAGVPTLADSLKRLAYL